MVSFLQPCLLTLLAREPAHGYNLLQGLAEFGFETEGLDPSLVYRALRDMEEQGLVQSNWDEESLGPQRRVYALTGDGEDALATWVQDLERTRGEIDRLLAGMQNSGQ